MSSESQSHLRRSATQVRRYGTSAHANLIISSSYLQLSNRVAAVLTACSLETPDLRVCLSVGTTPSGTLRELHKQWQHGTADLSNASFFLLDEFFPCLPSFSSAPPVSPFSHPSQHARLWPADPVTPGLSDSSSPALFHEIPSLIPQEDPHYAELSRTFLSHFSADQIVRPRRRHPAETLEEAAEAYAQQLLVAPLDVVLVGVGPKGEIGWTLHPGDDVEALSEWQHQQSQADAPADYAAANAIDISHASVYKNQRYGGCVSVSFAQLLRARRVVMLAVSRNKAEVVARVVRSSFEEFPCAASFLFHHHPCAQLFVNEGAATLLDLSVPIPESLDVFEDRLLLLRANQRFLAGERVICFSPHPDDTSISAGATLALLNDANTVTSCVATTGHRAFIPDTTREDRIRIREQEATAEAALLGANCEFLRLPLYDNGKLGEEDVLIIENYLKLKAPTVLFLPHTADTHPTHRDVLRGILEAIKRLYLSRAAIALQTSANTSSSTDSSPLFPNSSLLASPSIGSPFSRPTNASSSSSSSSPAFGTLRLFMYEGPWSLFPPASYNTIVSPPADNFAHKEAAILAHKSQVERTAYDKAADALATMRAVLVPEQDLAGFGGQGPRIDSKIELFYYYPIRAASDVDQLLAWFDERKHPVRFARIKL